MRPDATCPRCKGWREPLPGVTDFVYAYLLGMYLGDGMLSQQPRGVYRLRVFLDRKYPVIVAECQAAMSLVMPSSQAGVYRHRRANLDEVSSYGRHWIHLFPQHGTGPKHRRPIKLEPWQTSVARRHPGRLLRGLIHSDGCRVTNRVRGARKTYSYPRYLFANQSVDIQQIFTDACDQLGVQWRHDGPWDISVARRQSVAILDRHVGPKR